MGNCCKVVKKEKSKEDSKEIIKPVADSGTMMTEDHSQRSKTLQILCNSPQFNLSIRYRSAIPIQDIKEQILLEFPGLDLSKYSLFRDNLEILDATATLQQLGILAGDTLTLQLSLVSESEDVIASENNSIPEMRNEIVAHEITGLSGRKGLAARSSQETMLTSPKKPANELWRTALPSPPARQLIQCDPLDASSFTNNTQDLSLKPPQAPFQVKIPVGNMMESDDSNIEERKNARERENHTYFKDLQGPFFMFQKE